MKYIVSFLNFSSNTLQFDKISNFFIFHCWKSSSPFSKKLIFKSKWDFSNILVTNNQGTYEMRETSWSKLLFRSSLTFPLHINPGNDVHFAERKKERHVPFPVFFQYPALYWFRPIRFYQLINVQLIMCYRCVYIYIYIYMSFIRNFIVLLPPLLAYQRLGRHFALVWKVFHNMADCTCAIFHFTSQCGCILFWLIMAVDWYIIYFRDKLINK